MKHPPAAQKKQKRYYTRPDELLYDLTKKYPRGALDELINEIKHAYNDNCGYNFVGGMDSSTYVRYYLKKKYPMEYRQMVRTLITPQENMPLLINSKENIMLIVALWRLRQGK